MSSKIDLHQSIPSPTCLPSAKAVVNSPCQIHGLAVLLLFHSDIKKDLERKFYLKLTKQKNILQGTLCWCLLCVTGEEKEKKKERKKWLSSCFIILLLLFCFEYQSKPVTVIPGARRVKCLLLCPVSLEAGVTLIKDLTWGGMDFLRQPEGSNSSLRFQSMSRSSSGNSFSEQSEVFACPYSRLAHNPKHKLVASQLEIWHFAEPSFVWELIIKHSFSFKKK